MIEGDKYSDHDRLMKILLGDDMLDESLVGRHFKEVVCELPYETQEVVTPERDIIVPFYLPLTMLSVNYVEVNIYFPGLQDGDYPDNSPELYMIPVSNAYLYKVNGAFASFPVSDLGYFYVAGTGATGANYHWYRGFLRYHIAGLLGFDIDKAELHWTLNQRASAGAGVNTQHTTLIHSIDDFGTPGTAMWAFATRVNHGVGNIHTAAIRTAYSKDVTARIAALIGAGTKYSCFRIMSSGEPVDINNANNYMIDMPETLYVEMSEDTTEDVDVYWDNGGGFNLFGSYNADQEDLDFSAHFSGAGKKQIKIACPKTRRVDVLIRVGLTLDVT